MAKDCPKCEEGLPPWLATFADLMSLLMCFFVLLLSFAEVDAARFKKMAESMKDAFGVQRQVPHLDVVMGTSVIKQEFSPTTVTDPSPMDVIKQQTVEVEKEHLEVPEEEKSEQKEEQEEQEMADQLAEEHKDEERALEDDPKDLEGKAEELIEKQELEQAAMDKEEKEALEKEALEARMEEIQQEVEQQAEDIREALKDEIDQGLVSIETDKTKIIIRIQEKGSFPSGSADFNPGFLDVIDRISDAVVRAPGRVVVAGHTDDVPIYTDRFRSNWELSSARAVTVVHALLMNPGVAPDRVLVEGHAESKPLFPNDSTENRAKNRRVELILVRGEEEGKRDVIDVQ